MNPLFKECRPTGLSELPQFFPCSVPLQSWVVKSTLICKFLLTVDIVKGVTQLYSMQAKLHGYESLILGCTLAFWSSPSDASADAQHLFLNSERTETFWFPLGKWVWDRRSPQWKVDGSCCHAVNWCCPYWFGPHLSVPSSLLQSPRFLWEHI